jgi:hypothetical protein
MHELDRVLDRNDVVPAILVRVVEDRRQGRGFTGAGGSCNHDQSFVQHGKLFQHRRKRRVEFFKILKRKDFRGNLPENGRAAVLLIEKIGTKPGDNGDLVSEK